MQLHVGRSPEPNGTRDVTIEVLQRERPSVWLRGVRVSMPREGWLQLEIPTLHHWQSELQKLPEAVRNRIAEPEFCQVLQTQLTNRLMRERHEL